MWDPPIWGQLSTESQRREHLIAVIVLDDLSHGLEGHGIGIHLVWVHVVQWSRLGRISFQDKRSHSQWCKPAEWDWTDSCSKRNRSKLRLNWMFWIRGGAWCDCLAFSRTGIGQCHNGATEWGKPITINYKPSMFILNIWAKFTLCWTDSRDFSVKSWENSFLCESTI